MNESDTETAADLQDVRDREYREAYTSWLAVLPPAERAKLDRAGISKPDTERRVWTLAQPEQSRDASTAEQWQEADGAEGRDPLDVQDDGDAAEPAAPPELPPARATSNPDEAQILRAAIAVCLRGGKPEHVGRRLRVLAALLGLDPRSNRELAQLCGTSPAATCQLTAVLRDALAHELLPPRRVVGS